MNHYTNFITKTLFTKDCRDATFFEALSKLNNKPAKIFELGTSYDLAGHCRFSGGWSTYFWAKYISEYGGSLVTCDINANGLLNSKELISDFSGINVQFVNQNGNVYLQNNSNFDLIYLDGSDDPKDMVTQLNLCQNSLMNGTIILCDDFHTKGSIVKQIWKDYILYRNSTGHEMALFGKDIKFEIRAM